MENFLKVYPELDSEKTYLRSFIRQMLAEESGPWLMLNPEDTEAPKHIKRGRVLFRVGEVATSDDMTWSYGGNGPYCIAAVYPLGLEDEKAEENYDYTFWEGKEELPAGLHEEDLVQVVLRSGKKSTKPLAAKLYVWKYEEDELSPHNIIGYHVTAYVCNQCKEELEDLPEAGVWHEMDLTMENGVYDLPKGVKPDDLVKVRLQTFDDETPEEGKYRPAKEWDWSINSEFRSAGDILAYKIKKIKG